MYKILDKTANFWLPSSFKRGRIPKPPNGVTPLHKAATFLNTFELLSSLKRGRIQKLQME